MDLITAIEKTRRDLLELSARNRLIHTPLETKKPGWIQIVGERSDQLFDILVRQNKAMTFLPKAVDASATELQEFRLAFDSPSDNDSSGEDDEVEEDLTAPATEDSDGHTDLYLQTNIGSDKLHDKLLKCFYEARTSEEEQGVSILYLACGFLKWRESPTSTVNRFAPLLLIPVELSRNNARSKFRLKFRDDEIVTNLSIQARLQQDFGIRMPDLPESTTDDETWTPSKYFAEIAELVKEREGWELLSNESLLWFFSFTKFLMFRDLSPDAWPKSASLESNALLRSLLTDGFRQEESQSACSESEPIDTILNPADVIHVTDADSSQAIVINEIAQGRNLVVQGPPGTGKSQTITNAIAAAVHAGKRVLFVSEKMAALEVVKRRLDQLGLGPMTLELHSHKSRKQEVLAELKATLELGVPTGIKTVPLDELRQTVLRLREHDAALHGRVGKTGISPYHAMGQLMRLRSLGISPLAYQVKQAAEWTDQEYQSRKQLALELDKLLAQSGVPSQNPWCGARCKPMPPSDLERLVVAIKEIRPQVLELQSAGCELATIVGLPSPANLVSTSEIAQLAQYVKRCPEFTDRTKLTSPGWETDLPTVEKALENVLKLNELRIDLGGRVTDSGLLSDLNGTRKSLAAHGTSWFRVFNASYRKAIQTLRGISKESIPTTSRERVELVDKILGYQAALSQLERDTERCQKLLGEVWQGSETANEKANAIVQWVKESAKVKILKEHGRFVASGIADSRHISQPLSRIGKHLKVVDTGFAEIAKQLHLDLNVVFKTDQVRSVRLEDWLQRFEQWLAHTEQLSHYLAAKARMDRLGPGGLKRTVGEIENGIITAGKVADQLEFVRNEAVLSEAWRSIPGLGEFQGHSYEALRNRFAQLDKDRIAMSRLEVAKKHHSNFLSAAADSGQVGVVRREINKKRRHMPIRRLIKEAGHAIQKVKPVFMMSPLSVAQFLEPGAVEFDLLVIDEASQVQPVDALGAIARCRQIVVVGDQRQLPPTNFFGRVSGESDVDEDDDGVANAGDLESILGLCEAQGVPNRMLRWHYRSRHESLIAVSNRQFYENRLFIVPSPLTSGGPLGLKLRFVSNGCYDRGGTRANRNEAIAIADAVMDHARKQPELSLGVATFSAAQRDAILDELELRRREDSSVEDFFMAGGPAPFFVKSLENVQGDERDVVYISVGYARDKDGYFAHNFGPLVRKGGERRLNVLISRAASACEVFTSIRACDIDLNRSQSDGVAALKMYLNYAETGHLESEKSHGDVDSDFEDQVARALRSKGLEIDHQIGVGGFYIDLAIRDPENRGRYLLGIECDGAQFHSARWVRDRDRLRQQILESRGWHIHRIWSTDWFQRPEEQVNRVIEALADAKIQWDKADRACAESATIITGRINRDAPDSQPYWTRLEVSSRNDTVDCVVNEYVEADFAVREFSGSPINLNEQQLAKLVSQILETEAPIHLDEIGRRVIKLLGEGRLVASFKNKVESAVQLLLNRRAADRRGDFVSRAGQAVFVVRSRRSLENANLRKPELIAPEEIRAAVIRVVTDSIGTNVSETIASAAKMLGISNSQSTQAMFTKEIECLEAESTVEDRDGRLFVSV